MNERSSRIAKQMSYGRQAFIFLYNEVDGWIPFKLDGSFISRVGSATLSGNHRPDKYWGAGLLVT